MNQEIINTIIESIVGIIVFFGFLGFFLILGIMENRQELKKIGILKPKNKIISVNPDYDEKLRYQIKSSIILVVTIFIIFLLCKLFGISIKDIKDLF